MNLDLEGDNWLADAVGHGFFFAHRGQASFPNSLLRHTQP
jgi:hypothetical protein